MFSTMNIAIRITITITIPITNININTNINVIMIISISRIIGIIISMTTKYYCFSMTIILLLLV